LTPAGIDTCAGTNWWSRSMIDALGVCAKAGIAPQSTPTMATDRNIGRQPMQLIIARKITETHAG
jgi:hypothetical protein